jgi:predicted dehydrogenase
MSDVTRRSFIKSSMAVGAGLALAGPASHALGANNDIRVAVVGVGGQGGGHMRYFHGCEGARLVAICDADRNHVESRAKAFEDKEGYKLKTYTDVRKLLEDKEIDAITSATPNHWHALVTIWACQAGKDVYIEKPACHNIFEGRKMVEAARKYNRIVQVGMQKRSSEAHPAAFEWIREGHIGKIKWVRGFCYKGRGPGTNGIVHGTNGPNPLPASVDYDLWCGPADMMPLNRTQLHYVWHWMWNSGCGDIGNQGPHEMDIARWALGDPGLPRHAFSIGGRFGVGETDDVGETANTQIAYFDYKPVPIIFEVRGLPMKKGVRAMDNYRGRVYDNDGKKIKQFSGHGGAGHHENFIKAVRSHKVSDLNADIEVGHLSAALSHMANTSHRLGKNATPDEIKTTIGDNTEMMDSFNRMLEHLDANEVNLEKEPITVGPMLTMDAKKERYVGDHSEMANMFIKRNYREPFVVPENV